MSAPRVLVSGVVLGQPAGGVRRHNAELLPRVARLLRAGGGDLAVLEGRERIAFDLDPSIERVVTDVPSSPAWKRAARETGALRRALSAAREAGRPFDLVHVGHLPAPRALDTPFTVTLHDLRSLDPSLASVARRVVAERVLRDAVSRAARVFTVSATVGAELRARFAIDAERIVLVGNAADHLRPLSRRPEPDAPIVCIGHLEPRKNLDVVVRALALDQELPSLELHGSAKRGEDARLRRLARELGVEARVRLCGPFDDAELPRILATCACVALPSRVEGFGIVALEAQRALAPLAVSRAGALPEVAGDSTPSFDPDDALGCARALRTAIASSSRELAAARERADRVTWDECARRWSAGLTEAASAAQRPPAS